MIPLNHSQTVRACVGIAKLNVTHLNKKLLSLVRKPWRETVAAITGRDSTSQSRFCQFKFGFSNSVQISEFRRAFRIVLVELRPLHAYLRNRPGKCEIPVG